MTRAVIDGCAGPGGWDVAAHALGLEPLGIEWDPAACETRAAAGLRTLQADVASVDLATIMADHFDAGELWGLIFSPPCPTFSMAGGGSGRRLIDLIVECALSLARGVDRRRECIDEARAILEPLCWAAEQAAAAKKGRHPDRGRSDARAARDAGMSMLVVEPIRYAVALRPRWVALEQVETVQLIWDAFAQILADLGYHYWTGVVSAEQYGVPQTRRRALLLASQDAPVDRPVPTHQRYIAPRRREEATDSLFAAEPERIVHREDRGLLPWVSMARALGWGMTAAPTTTVVTPRGGGCETHALDGGSDARRRYADARAEGRWQFRAANDRPNGALREPSAPAPALAFGHNQPVWLRTGNFTAIARDADGERSADGSVPYERAVSEPAPTVRAAGAGEWVTHLDQRQGKTQDDGSRRMVPPRPVSEPSPTLSAVGLARGRDVWTTERPATTVAGDPRVFPPGHKLNADDEAAGRGGQQRSGAGWTEGRPSTTVTGTSRSEDGGTQRAPSAERPERGGEAQAVRVTVEEAAALQSFPAGYPWRGTKTKVFEQIGNAVPPLLAWAALRAIPGVAEWDVAA